MKSLIKTLILGAILIPFLSLMPAYAAPGSAGSSSASINEACQGLTELDSSQDCSSGSGTVNSLVSTVVMILSYIIGVIAIIMIIVAALRFVTAGGNSQSISGAKNTLIFAIIGIVLAVLAQVIVRWVIGTSSNVASGSGLILLIHHLY